MQAFFGLLEFITSITLLVGIVAVIKPFGPVKRRKHAVGVIVASVLAGMVAAPLSPHPPPPQAAPASASGQPANASAAAAEAKPKPEKPTDADIAASFLKTQKAMFDAIKPCDQAMTKATRTHGRYASYNVSVAAGNVCSHTAQTLYDLQFADPVPKVALEDLNKAVQCFSLAYRERASAMEEAVKLFDNDDMRPSKIAEFRGDLSDAYAQSKDCEHQFALGAAAGGLSDQVGKGFKD